MNLILSKFTPDLISKLPSAFLGIELEWLSYLSWSPRERQRLRRWLQGKGLKVIPRLSLRPRREPEELEEVMTTALEELGAALDFFSLSSGFRRFDRNPLESSGLTDELKTRFKIFFEWGEDDSPVRVASLGPLIECGFILDAVTHARMLKKAGAPLHFKLHGWHPDRWVRRYGATQIKLICERIRGNPDACLFLSYSGRLDEVDLFFRELSEWLNRV